MDTESETKHKKNTSILDQTPSIVPGHRKQLKTELHPIQRNYFSVYEESQKGIDDVYILKSYSYSKYDKLGSGNYSTVYKGKNIYTSQVVAIKAITQKTLQDPLVRPLIENEVKCLQMLDSPYILKILEIEDRQTEIFIITEYCNGGDLGTMISRRGYIKEELALKIGKDILQGMKEMKKNNIVHRDIKPDNILMNEGNAKIADLGFAFVLDQKIINNMNFGSPSYMSPESLKHGIHNFQSDIWSFGVLLFEMIYGFLPYHAKNESCLLIKIQAMAIDFPLFPKISQQLKSLFQRIFTVDPEQRITLEEIDSLSLFQFGDNRQIVQQENQSKVIKSIKFKTCNDMDPVENLDSPNKKQIEILQKKEKILIEQNISTPQLPRTLLISSNEKLNSLKERIQNGIKVLKSDQKIPEIIQNKQELESNYSSKQDKSNEVVQEQENFQENILTLKAMIDYFTLIFDAYEFSFKIEQNMPFFRLTFVLGKTCQAIKNQLKQQIIQSNNILNLPNWNIFITSPSFRQIKQHFETQDVLTEINLIKLCFGYKPQLNESLLDPIFKSLYSDNNIKPVQIHSTLEMFLIDIIIKYFNKALHDYEHHQEPEQKIKRKFEFIEMLIIIYNIEQTQKKGLQCLTKLNIQQMKILEELPLKTKINTIEKNMRDIGLI